MTTKISFENAVLADAVAKAGRVAPNKGAAFDMAAGFLFEVDVQRQQVILSATDLAVTFKMQVPALSASGDSVTWRIPSAVLSGLMGGLSMTAEASTELVDRGDGSIRLKSGHTAARLNMIPVGDYPRIPDYDQSGMTAAQTVAARIELVAWATDSTGSGPMSGIRVDGKRLIGVNPYGIAVVPCEVALPEPVTVPLFLLSPLLKGASDVMVKSDGDRFIIGLDAETTATTQLLRGEFVQVDKVLRSNFEALVTVRRQSFIDCLNQILVLVKIDRQPSISLTLDCEGMISMLRIDAEVPEIGRMQTAMDVGTDFEGSIQLNFKPATVLAAVEHAKGDLITFGMGNSDNPGAMASMCVSDSGGYTCYVMPKKV